VFGNVCPGGRTNHQKQQQICVEDNYLSLHQLSRDS
jgi:hypothetical protein